MTTRPNRRGPGSGIAALNASYFPQTLIKPPRLKRGDRIAAVTPSWGGPALFPDRYKAGKHEFEAVFGVEIVEMAHTLAPADWLAANPAARADDIMTAFADPGIAGLITTIGGDDSVRLVPHLDLDPIATFPKVFMGFSDTTSLHFACQAAGLSSFYGPSLMAGFGENAGMHVYTRHAVRTALFEPGPIGAIPRNLEGWTAERTDWADPEAQKRPRPLAPAEPPSLLQGTGRASGRLIGGCAEVIEMLKATPWWPPLDYWDGAILFYETSEEVPDPGLVRYWFRNFAAQGILDRLSGLLIARPDPGGDTTYAAKLETAILSVLAEDGLTDLPVLSGLDFGHTQPMTVLPYGAEATIDCETKTLTIDEPGTA